MIVNAYVVWDELTRFAWIFDTGTNFEPILRFLEEQHLKADAIFLTHTHLDDKANALSSYRYSFALENHIEIITGQKNLLMLFLV